MDEVESRDSINANVTLETIESHNLPEMPELLLVTGGERLSEFVHPRIGD